MIFETGEIELFLEMLGDLANRFFVVTKYDYFFVGSALNLYYLDAKISLR